MSCVHYKFRSSLEYDTITFDGLAISLGELKSSIMSQKKFGKNADFDLEVKNAQTNEVYKEETTLIPKNSSVVVRRIPVGTKSKAQIASDKSDTLSSMGTKTTDFQDYQGSFKTQPLRKTANLAKANATEDDKLKAMMSQAGEDWDPSQYVRGRGRGFSGSVPNNYVCYRCGKPGHFIRSCPTNGDTRFDVPKVKRTTGIPRMFLANDGGASGGSSPLRTSQEDVVKESKKDKSGPAVAPPVQPEPKKVPSELKCPMCNNLLTDAVLIPCCGTSYCDDCIRTYLLDDEHSVCPTCGQENVLPDSLVINKQLRQAVNNFRNPRSSSPFPNTSQQPVVSKDSSQDTVKSRKEEISTVKSLDVEKVITGSPSRSREASPKVFKTESGSESSKPLPPNTGQTTGQVPRPQTKDPHQSSEGNVIKPVQKTDGVKMAISTSRAQDAPRPITGKPRDHVPRVPGIRPPPQSASISMHTPPYPGAPPTMSVARLYMPGGPVVARPLHLKPGPMVVSSLRPPAHDPFAIAVRPAFLDPFGPPDDHLPPPMSEEEFNRLQKGYKSRHKKKRDVSRESKRTKETERGRERSSREHDREARERDREGRERDREVRERDQDDRGSDRESRGRRRGREVDFADELSQYRKLQRSRQRSSSWPRSRSYSRSESRSYSRSRSRSRSFSRSASRSPTPEGWDRSRDPTPASSLSASRDMSHSEGSRKDEDTTRRQKKRKKHDKHKRDKKQKTSNEEGNRTSEKSSDNDKKLKRKLTSYDSEKPKKKHKKNRKDSENVSSKKSKSSDNKQRKRTELKQKDNAGARQPETSTLKRNPSSKKNLKESSKLEKQKTKNKSSNLSKSKKAKLSENVEDKLANKKKKSNKSSRSTKEKEKSSSDERKKKKKHRSRSKKHKKKHKHKKKSKSGEARKKATNPYSGSEREEGMSDQATDFRGSQETGTVSDSSNEDHDSTQSNDIDKMEEKVVSSDSDSKRALVREPGKDYDSSDSADGDNYSVGVDNKSEYNHDNSDPVDDDDDDDDDDEESVSNDNDGNISNNNDGSLVDDDDDDDDNGDSDNCVDNDLSDSVGIQSEEEVDDEKAEIENQEGIDPDNEEEQSGDESQVLEAEVDNDVCHQESDSKERKSTEEQNFPDCTVEEDKVYSQCEISKAIKDTCKEEVVIENAENEKSKTSEPVNGSCVKPNDKESENTVDYRHFDDVNGDNRTRSSCYVCDSNNQSEKVDHVLEEPKIT